MNQGVHQILGPIPEGGSTDKHCWVEDPTCLGPPCAYVYPEVMVDIPCTLASTSVMNRVCQDVMGYCRLVVWRSGRKRVITHILSWLLKKCLLT